MEQATLQRRVRVIPATKPQTQSRASPDQKQRVAAYCRVSTDSEEQLTSYTAQKSYYTKKIQENPQWEMAGIFADATIIIGLNLQNLVAQGMHRFSSICLQKNRQEATGEKSIKMRCQLFVTR